MKKIVAVLERVQKREERKHLHLTCAFEPANPSVERIGLPHQKRIIRSKRRVHAQARNRAVELAVMRQAVARIVCGAHHAHVKFSQYPLRREIAVL
jgi:hypothetical protein